MERYYLVQAITTATARNVGFPDEVHCHLYGKAQELLQTSGHKTEWHNRDFLTPFFVRQYGYKRECDARRSWIYKNPNCDRPYWETEVKVVEAWIKSDNTVSIVPMV